MKKILKSKKIWTIATISLIVLGSILLIIGLHVPVTDGVYTLKWANINLEIDNIFTADKYQENSVSFKEPIVALNRLLDIARVGASFLFISIPMFLWTAYLWLKK